MARSSAAVALLVGLGGGVALFLIGRGGASKPGPAAIHDGEAQVTARLTEVSAAVGSRAATLAEMPRLKSAVVTDAATVMDLTQDELAFQVKPGETIEIAQIPKGGKPVSLLRLPAASKASPPLDAPGAHILAVDGKIVVSHVVEVMPSQGGDMMRGMIAVSGTADLSDFQKWLDALPFGGSFELAAPVLVSRAPVAGRRMVSELTAPKFGEKPRLVVGVKRGANLPLQGAGGGLALVGIIAAVVLGRRKPAATSGASIVDKTAGVGTAGAAAMGGRPSVAAAAVDPSGRTDIGTPPPLAPGRAPVSTPVAVPGASAALAAALAADGTGQIGRYTIVKSLGTGGMAEVYLARSSGEAGFEKLVALKVMHRHLSQLKEIVDHFLDEARLASTLLHPNIVQIYDLGKAGDDYYIALEYVDGRDLESLLAGARARGTPVPLRVAMSILRKICDGLEAAHTATASDGKPLDLVHRDVKTANVLMSKAGEVKIGDFGIAKANQQIHKTEFGQTKGTVAYMAPEQRMGKVVDRRADLFAVGAIAYELFTGAAVNLDLGNLFHLGLEGWPHLPPPSQVRPDLPRELDQVIFKALAFEPEHRQASCAAFEAELEVIAEKYQLNGSGKLIAQWLQGELAKPAPPPHPV